MRSSSSPQTTHLAYWPNTTPHHTSHKTQQGNNYPGSQPYQSLKDQKAFEKGLLEKTAKQTSDVILYDNRVVVFKMESDVMLYVVGWRGGERDHAVQCHLGTERQP